MGLEWAPRPSTQRARKSGTFLSLACLMLVQSGKLADTLHWDLSHLRATSHAASFACPPPPLSRENSYITLGLNVTSLELSSNPRLTEMTLLCVSGAYFNIVLSKYQSHWLIITILIVLRTFIRPAYSRGQSKCLSYFLFFPPGPRVEWGTYIVLDNFPPTNGYRNK